MSEVASRDATKPFTGLHEPASLFGAQVLNGEAILIFGLAN
jgi:hypothetical protein